MSDQIKLILNEEIFDLKGGLTERLQQKGMEDAAGTVEKYIKIVKREGMHWSHLDEEDECKVMMDMLVGWGESVSAAKYVECFWNMHFE